MSREAAVGTLAALAAVAAIAWGVTIDRMVGMDAGPGTDLGSLGWFFVGWMAMMGAMMLPSLTPAAISFARIEAEALTVPGSPEGMRAMDAAGMDTGDGAGGNALMNSLGQ